MQLRLRQVLSKAPRKQCFCFQNDIKYFLDTLIQNFLMYIMNLTNFQGDLTDISAKKEALRANSLENLIEPSTDCREPGLPLLPLLVGTDYFTPGNSIISGPTVCDK